MAEENKFDDILEKIGKLSVVELADLISALEKKFNVSAMMPVAAVGAAAVEEKQEVNVVLKVTGDQKVNVIKVVKELSGLGLKEAKAIVDGAPGVVKRD